MHELQFYVSTVISCTFINLFYCIFMVTSILTVFWIYSHKIAPVIVSHNIYSVSLSTGCHFLNIVLAMQADFFCIYPWLRLPVG